MKKLIASLTLLVACAAPQKVSHNLCSPASTRNVIKNIENLSYRVEYRLPRGQCDNFHFGTFVEQFNEREIRAKYYQIDSRLEARVNFATKKYSCHFINNYVSCSPKSYVIEHFVVEGLKYINKIREKVIGKTI